VKSRFSGKKTYVCCSYSETVTFFFSLPAKRRDSTLIWLYHFPPNTFHFICQQSYFNSTLPEVLQGVVKTYEKRDSTTNAAMKSYLEKIIVAYVFLWLYSPIQALAASMKLCVSLQLLDLGQSVGLLGRVISSSQGLYLYTNTEKRIHNINTKHPCPE
jgi:hypothetical protein